MLFSCHTEPVEVQHEKSKTTKYIFYVTSYGTNIKL